MSTPSPSTVQPQAKVAERRRFFRVNDRVGLTMRELPEQDLASATQRVESERSVWQILSAIQTLTDAQVAPLKALEQLHPAATKFMKQVDDKVNLIASYLATQVQGPPDSPTHDVNISASGVSFSWHQATEVGSLVELKMRLFPSAVGLLLYGRVVTCRPDREPGLGANPSQRWFTGVDYADMPESERTVLIKHVQNLQRDRLRHNRAN